jgi:hypothetical protein
MLPILQMIIEPNDNGYFGLKFTTETEEYLPPAFVIPMPAGERELQNEYYMPGEIRGEYVNFIARFNKDFNFLVIDDKRLGNTSIRFQLSYENPFFSDIPILHKFPFQKDFPRIIAPYTQFRYIGNEIGMVHDYSRFVLLNPIDLLIMDGLYQKMKACFVGLTPAYGDRIFEDNQRL